MANSDFVQVRDAYSRDQVINIRQIIRVHRVPEKPEYWSVDLPDQNGIIIDEAMAIALLERLLGQREINVQPADAASENGGVGIQAL